MTSLRPLRPRHHAHLPLSELLGTSSQVPVSGLSVDSRQIQPGDIYVALPGSRAHGADYADKAIAAGAVAIFTDEVGAARLADLAVPVIADGDPRSTMAAVAARLYGHPAAAMTMLAVTGTNGKTTTAHLLEAGLLAAGRHPGVIGTIGFRLDGAGLPGARTTVTTPESIDLQALLAAMAERGADSIAMEVSSHALSLNRVDDICFDVAGFTNLGRDHLDFHHTMDNYFAAKAQLFTARRARCGVIDLSGPYAEELCERAEIPTVTVGVDRDGDYRATSTIRPDGAIELELSTPAGRVHEALLRLPGRHNVHNAAVAAAMLDVADVDLADALPGFAQVQIPGRMQPVDLGVRAPAVYVDFAHTPQAVAAACASFPNRLGRLIIVLGCGGDRDPDKRGPMGEAAALGADLVVVTDDNPRTEDPAAIRAAVLRGAAVGTAIDGGDRRTAIATALREAQPDDIVAVLGKGHETGQEINGRIVAFDDVVVIGEEWGRR